MRHVINDAFLDRFKLPKGKQQVRVSDTKQPGFAVVFGKKGGMFVVQYVREGVAAQESIAPCRILKPGATSFPEGALTVVEARKQAIAIKGRVVESRLTPLQKENLTRVGPTVREAIEAYLLYLTKNCCWTSVVSARKDLLGKHLADWHERRLSSITPMECEARHAEIAVKHSIRCGGKHAANRVLRYFSTVWDRHARRALRGGESWPANPTQVVDYFKKTQPGFTRRRRQPLPWSALRAWATSVDAMKRKHLRVYHWLVLLTAMRKVSAATIRWEHANLTTRRIEARVWNPATSAFDTKELPPATLLCPYPKGGPGKAYVVALPKVIVKMLRELRESRSFDDRGWVFPGKMAKSKECMYCTELGQPAHVKGQMAHMADVRESGIGEGDSSPHRLRDTFATAANKKKVSLVDIATLLNHEWAGGGNVTAGYIKPDIPHLRSCQEKVVTFLMSKARSSRATGQ